MTENSGGRPGRASRENRHSVYPYIPALKEKCPRATEVAAAAWDVTTEGARAGAIGAGGAGRGAAALQLHSAHEFALAQLSAEVLLQTSLLVDAAFRQSSRRKRCSLPRSAARCESPGAVMLRECWPRRSLPSAVEIDLKQNLVEALGKIGQLQPDFGNEG